MLTASRCCKSFPRPMRQWSRRRTRAEHCRIRDARKTVRSGQYLPRLYLYRLRVSRHGRWCTLRDYQHPETPESIWATEIWGREGSAGSIRGCRQSWSRCGVESAGPLWWGWEAVWKCDQRFDGCCMEGSRNFRYNGSLGSTLSYKHRGYRTGLHRYARAAASAFSVFPLLICSRYRS